MITADIVMYRGKRLDAMTREELIEVILDQQRLNQAFITGAEAEREMFGRIIQSARPRSPATAP